MVTDVARPGFIVLTKGLDPLAYNSEAVNILTFPDKPEVLKNLASFLRNMVQSKLVTRQHLGDCGFVTQFVSGKRIYTCTVLEMQVTRNGGSEHRSTRALLLQRTANPSQVRKRVCDRFRLTPREQQIIELLVQGLTSKEIAGLLSLSPNTIKTFLHLIMTKMNVSTRSAVVGKILDAGS